MNVIYPFLLVIHVIIALSLVVSVLMQSSKGEGLAGAFGGGGLSGAVFGGRGAATFLSKATTVLAVGFMLTSITLLISLGLSSGGSTSSGVLQDLQEGPSDLAPPPATTVPGEVPAGQDAGAEGLFQQTPPPEESGE